MDGEPAKNSDRVLNKVRLAAAVTAVAAVVVVLFCGFAASGSIDRAGSGAAERSTLVLIEPRTEVLSPTAAPTLTPAPTAAPTETPTPTPSPTPTPTPTATPSPTPTPTPTPSPTPTPTRKPSTPTPRPTKTPTPTAFVTGIDPAAVFRSQRSFGAAEVSEGCCRVIFDPGADVYYSKADFVNALLTDFYYYVRVRNGGNFPSGKYNSLDTYLSYLTSYNGVMNNFEPLSDNICGYFLSKDPFGDLANQKYRKGFVGFCFQNGRYVDFFYYIKEAFYYWRTEEGYGLGDPEKRERGRDMLSESWAPFVDMCKIFYYNAQTIQPLYPKSTRTYKLVRDFPFAATPDRTLPTEYDPNTGIIIDVKLTRPGYTFRGWYRDPGCTGEAVTALPAGTTGDITPYAGWVKN